MGVNPEYRWPLADLLFDLRGLHQIVANEAADRLVELTAEVARLVALVDGITWDATMTELKRP